MRFVVAALLLTACMSREPMAENVASKPVPAAPAAPRLVVLNPQAVAVDPYRNLFAFAATPAIVHTAVPVAVQPIAVPAPEPVVVVQQRVETPFPYRYVGRFGPDSSPFAVFVREGEVINARAGDAVGEFRLQRIGIESVDVVAAAGGVQRISL